MLCQRIRCLTCTYRICIGNPKLYFALHCEGLHFISFVILHVAIYLIYIVPLNLWLSIQIVAYYVGRSSLLAELLVIQNVWLLVG